MKKAFHIIIAAFFSYGIILWCLYEESRSDSAVAHCDTERDVIEATITNRVEEVVRKIIDSWGEIDISHDVSAHKKQCMRNFAEYTNSISVGRRDVAAHRERNNLKRKVLDGRLCDGHDASVYQLMGTNVVDAARMMPLECFAKTDENWEKIKVFFKKDRKWWQRDLPGIRITLYGLHLEKLGVAETSFRNHLSWVPWKDSVVLNVNWRVCMNEVPRYYKLELK